MKLSILSLALFLSLGFASALPHAWANGEDDGGEYKHEGEGEGEGKEHKHHEEHGPPGPPSGSYGSVSQSCSAKQSSISCCNQGGSKSHKVYYAGNAYDMQCSQVSGEFGKPVQSICETTVACCQGAGCIAIAY